MSPRTSLCLFAAFTALGVLAHPGGLDSQGGHMDRKTGIYHYHRGTNAPGNPPLKPKSSSLVASNTAGENTASNAAAVESNEPGVLVKSGTALKQLPWWVYLVVLGGGYALWEIACYFWQKKKGKE